MILFYNKEDIKNAEGEVIKPAGSIFGAIDGRVHREQQLQAHMDGAGLNESEVGKYIIGTIRKADGSQVGYNLDKFDILRRFEDITPESPLDYKIDIETGDLIHK